MTDFLDLLARNAKETINDGYYDVSTHGLSASISLKKSILKNKNIPIITEIKAASPSLGKIRSNFDPAKIGKAMANGGAAGISIVTEPKHFSGSIKSFKKARNAIELPILMKDIIISPIQLETASKIGANAVLLIQALFDRGYCEYNVHKMIEVAQSKNLEVLLETHNYKEFQSAIKSKTDLVGINNRDLRTLEVNLKVTKNILEKSDAHGKIVVSESGVKTLADLKFLIRCGAHAFLIGSSIMMATNIEKKVKEYVTGL